MSDKSSSTKSGLKRFILLYGSQTGQAKAIAEEVADQAEAYGLLADLHCLSATDKKFTLEREACAVVVVSTTGDGEPPDTASKFWRRLKKTTNPSTLLSGVKYALLALGDSNYTNFCNFGKTLDKRLLQLGASHFMATAHADDAVGLETVVEPWISSLWPALQSHLQVEGNSENTHLNTENSDDMSVPTTNSKLGGGDGDSMNLATDTAQENFRLSSDVVDTGGDHELKQTIGTSSGAVIAEMLSGDSTLLNESGDNFRTDVNGEVNMCASLCASVPPLSECKLTIPPSPPIFLQIVYCPENSLNLQTLPVQNGMSFPSCVSSIMQVPIVSALTLTSEDAVKTVLELTLDISETDFTYLPGDAFGFITENIDEEVSALIKRLNLSEVADVCMEIQINDKPTKKNASIPVHLPPVSTLRHVLRTCCDIRSVPKKALLRTLVDYTTNAIEKRRLQELCSRQGGDDYSHFIKNNNLSLLEVLAAFPSCAPPVERILEHLPRLQPRPYSVASSPLVDSKTVKVVFTLVKIPCDDGTTKEGICTGWLNKITHPIQHQSSQPQQLEDTFSNLNLMDSVKIPIFKRARTKFCLPEDCSTPMILIGPGTGLAPFIGFLQHREMQRRSQAETNIGNIWLFFGCRHEDKDFLYQKYLQHCVDFGVLDKLFVTFSRSSAQSAPNGRYVQDCIVQNAEEIVKMIVDKHAMVFVCGDAKNMSKDVLQAIVTSFVFVKGVSQEEGANIVKNMQDKGLYLQDVWS